MCTETVSEFDRVKSIADDILVFGKSIILEDNANLEALLIRLLEAGLTINRKKCVIGVKEVSSKNSDLAIPISVGKNRLRTFLLMTQKQGNLIMW